MSACALGFRKLPPPDCVISDSNYMASSHTSSARWDDQRHEPLPIALRAITHSIHDTVAGDRGQTSGGIPTAARIGESAPRECARRRTSRSAIRGQHQHDRWPDRSIYWSCAMRSPRPPGWGVEPSRWEVAGGLQALICFAPWSFIFDDAPLAVFQRLAVGKRNAKYFTCPSSSWHNAQPATNRPCTPAL